MGRHGGCRTALAQRLLAAWAIVNLRFTERAFQTLVQHSTIGKHRAAGKLDQAEPTRLHVKLYTTISAIRSQKL
jgi:hypothetical protein